MEDPIIGVYPATDVLRRFVDRLKQRIRDAITPTRSIAEHHNAYTDYCLGMLFCCTDHRTVTDPFQSLTHFDLKEGLLLVADKVHAENRAWRLVALPEMAAGQVEAYLAYLPKLASALKQRGTATNIAESIHRLTTDSSTDIPLFFYLDEQDDSQWLHVSQATITNRWETFWPLPVNFLRHIAANELLLRTGRADWTQIQLGHMTGVDHPLGITSTSTQSPLEILAEIRRHSEVALKALEWQIVRSPLRATGPIPPDKSGFRNKKKESKKKGIILGHEKRAILRTKKIERAADLIKVLLAKHLPDKPLQDITKEEFNVVLEAIIQGIPLGGVSQRHGLLLVYRFLLRQKGGKDLLRRASKIRPIEPEPSPFSESSLSDYKKLQAVRQSFLDYLDRQGREKATICSHQRRAELIISAALFSGIVNPSWLQRLGDLEPEATYRIGQEIFVEIPLTEDKQAPVFRWHPDPISLGLLLGLYAPLINPLQADDSRNTLYWLKSILAGISENSAQTIDHLIKLSASGLTLERPGYIAAVLRGDQSSVSIPKAQFVRVIADKALAEEYQESSNPSTADTIWLPRLTKNDGSKCSPTIGGFLHHLQKTMLSCREVPNMGIAKRRKKQKQLLAKTLMHYATDTHGWPELAVIITAWTLHLCKVGTRFKSDLAYNTVCDYVLLVASPLANLLRTNPITTLSDIQIEELYIRVLEFVPASRKAKLAGRLQEFHYFLVQYYAMDNIDWSSIMASSGRDSYQYYADANIITESEYLHIIAYILNDESLPQLLRFQYASLLLLGYRFGLRFGEAWRIQYRDVQYEDDLDTLWILVRDTVFGDVKTQAATRLVSLLEQLTTHEKDVLNGVLREVKHRFETDQLIPLMADTDPRTLIDRSQAAQYLNSLLKHVTGDQSIRYHHLRHSWVTRILGHLLLRQNMRENEVAMRFLPAKISHENLAEFLGNCLIIYPLKSLSVATGHVRETTTLSSYCHCLDRIAGDHSTTRTPKLSDFAQAYCQQTASATIRRRRARTEG